MLWGCFSYFCRLKNTLRKKKYHLNFFFFCIFSFFWHSFGVCNLFYLQKLNSAKIRVCENRLLQKSASAKIDIWENLRLRKSTSMKICVCKNWHLRKSASAKIDISACHLCSVLQICFVLFVFWRLCSSASLYFGRLCSLLAYVPFLLYYFCILSIFSGSIGFRPF